MIKKNKNIKIVGITLKPNSTPEFYRLLPNLCAWLLKRQKQVVFKVEEQERIHKFFKNKSTESLSFGVQPSSTIR